MMANPSAFVDSIKHFDKDDVPDFVLDRVRPIIAQPFFTFEEMKKKSTAASYLAKWVINIVAYSTIQKKLAQLTKEQKESCVKDLADVMPTLEAALDALNCLSKADIVEVKSMSKPPSAVVLTSHALC